MSHNDFEDGVRAERRRCAQIVATAADMDNRDVPAGVMLERVLRLVLNGPPTKPKPRGPLEAVAQFFRGA